MKDGKRKQASGKLQEKNMNRTMGMKEWLLILLLSILWGGSFFFIEVAVKEMILLTIVLCRVGLASVILMMYVYGSGKLIYFRVLSTSGATNLMLVTFLIPLSAILLGVFILDEQLTWNAFGGMMLIFSGLIAIDGRIISTLRRKAVWSVLEQN